MTLLETISVLGGVIQYQFAINERIKKAFQDCSNDFNPLHNDPDFAGRKGFPECVMYGNILNCFLSFFIGELLPTKDVIIHSQEITYRKPVFLNDILNFKAEIYEIIEAVNTVIYKYTFKNQASQTVAKGKIQIGILPDLR